MWNPILSSIKKGSGKNSSELKDRRLDLASLGKLFGTRTNDVPNADLRAPVVSNLLGETQGRLRERLHLPRLQCHVA